MQVYFFRTTITTAGGSGSSNSNSIIGGLLRQVYLLAGTSTTIFRATLVDENSATIRSYDFHRGEINDDHSPPIVVQGIYTINIQNVSTDGPFTCVLGIQE